MYSARELRSNEFNLLKRVERQVQNNESKKPKEETNGKKALGINFHESKKPKEEYVKKKIPRDNNLFFKESITKLGIFSRRR